MDADHLAPLTHNRLPWLTAIKPFPTNEHYCCRPIGIVPDDADRLRMICFGQVQGNVHVLDKEASRHSVLRIQCAIRDRVRRRFPIHDELRHPGGRGRGDRQREQVAAR